MLGKPALVLFLREEIANHGPLPFARFMEQALYHPEYGYYTDAAFSRIGRQGDFYTSVSVGTLFGQLLAQQFAQMWEILGRPDPFPLIEQGANDGRFAADVLQWIRECRPDLFRAVRYDLIEPWPGAQARQKRTFTELELLEKVRWAMHPERGCGVVFSNELVDSFPVHRIVCLDGLWHESHVAWEAGRFTWKNLPVTHTELTAAMQTLGLPAIPHYTTEVNLESRRWLQKIAEPLDRGFIMTVDYGYLKEDYYDPQRSEGFLRCYRQHQRSEDPLEWVGEQDITTHVDFSALMEAGESVGLKTLGFTDQHHFMIGLAHEELTTFEQRGRDLDPQDRETVRAFRTLMHPEIMGSSFKYLLQSKGIETCPPLKGLLFARKH